jgi:hypothetical protein
MAKQKRGNQGAATAPSDLDAATPATKKPRGRITIDVVRKVIELWYKGFSLDDACEQVGVSRTGFFYARRDNPVFKAEFDAAMEAMCDLAEAQMARDAVSGHPSIRQRAREFMLTNLRRDRWKHNQQIDVSQVTAIRIIEGDDDPGGEEADDGP